MRSAPTLAGGTTRTCTLQTRMGKYPFRRFGVRIMPIASRYCARLGAGTTDAWRKNYTQDVDDQQCPTSISCINTVNIQNSTLDTIGNTIQQSCDVNVAGGGGGGGGGGGDGGDDDPDDDGGAEPTTKVRPELFEDSEGFWDSRTDEEKPVIIGVGVCGSPNTAFRFT